MTVINVCDIGAIGDGVFDNHDVFRAAINICNAAGGGVIYIPKGIFATDKHETTSSFYLTGNIPIKFIGDGPGLSIIKMRDFVQQGNISITSGANLIDGDNFTINDGKNPPIMFVFYSNTHVIETPVRRAIFFTTTDSSLVVKNTIIDAINKTPNLGTIASAGTGNTIIITPTTRNASQANITEAVGYAGFTASGFSGQYITFRIDNNQTSFENLTFDGNRNNILNTDQQVHLIQSENSDDLSVINCEFKNATRDGIKLVGNAGAVPNLINRVIINKCRFINCGRSGITIQRAITDCRITDCYFENINDQTIDFEPTGATGDSRMIISGNICRGNGLTATLTLSGIGGSDLNDSLIFTDNIITSGSVFASDIKNLVIKGNIITGAPGQRALEMNMSMEKVVCSNNIIKATGEVAVHMGASGNGTNRFPRDAVISDNLVESNIRGIHIESGQRIVISNNSVVGIGTATVEGIQARTTVPAYPIAGMVITGNQLNGWATGIEIDASSNGDAYDCLIGGNVINHFTATGKKGLGFNTVAPHTIYNITIAPNRFGTGIGTPINGANNITGPTT